MGLQVQTFFFFFFFFFFTVTKAHRDIAQTNIDALADIPGDAYDMMCPQEKVWLGVSQSIYLSESSCICMSHVHKFNWP